MKLDSKRPVAKQEEECRFVSEARAEAENRSSA